MTGVAPNAACDRCGHMAMQHEAFLGECGHCSCLEFAEAETLQALVAECDQLQDLLTQANEKCAVLFRENSTLREHLSEEHRRIQELQTEARLRRTRDAPVGPLPDRTYLPRGRPSSGGLDGND